MQYCTWITNETGCFLFASQERIVQSVVVVLIRSTVLGPFLFVDKDPEDDAQNRVSDQPCTLFEIPSRVLHAAGTHVLLPDLCLLLW